MIVASLCRSRYTGMILNLLLYGFEFVLRFLRRPLLSTEVSQKNGKRWSVGRGLFGVVVVSFERR